MTQQKHRENKKTALIRLQLLLVAFVLGALVLAARLCYIMLIDNERYEDGAFNQYTTEMSITPKRGTIYDRNMKALAVSATVETVCISPNEILTIRDRNQNKVEENQKTDKDLEEIARRKEYIASGLSVILDVDRALIEKKMLNTKSKYEIIKKNVERELADTLRAYLKEHKLEGFVYFEESTKRYYPDGNLASHVIGFTNYDNVGIYGVEAFYENYLKGSAGKIITAQNGKGGDMPFKYESYIGAQNGTNVVLTIDWSIQYFLEKALNTALEETKARNRVMGIVMDVNSGEILGMSVKPDMDLNDPYTLDTASQALLDAFEGSDEDRAALRRDLLESLWKNKTVTEPYEPGSTFKIITSGMALEEGVVHRDDSFDCTGKIRVGGWTINCHHREGHGHQNFEQGLQNSCNPVFVQVSERIGQSKFMDYFESFGFMQKTGVDLPGEVTSIYHTRENFNQTELAVYSFGQTFKVTPLQQVCAVSAVANGGKLMKPHIVKELVDDDGNVVESFEPEVVRQVLTEQTCKEVMTYLQNGINIGSTKNANVEGYSIGAKTGTSQKRDKVNPVSGNKDLYIASCVAFAPVEDPQIAVIVAIDEPVGAYYGGTIAAPVVSSILSDVLPYLNVEKKTAEADSKNARLTVGDYRGLSLDKAEENITNDTLKFKVIGNGKTVSEQFPHPGYMVENGGIVILYTGDSTPEKTSTVPSVIGQSASSANKSLVNAHLNILYDGAHNSNVSGALAVKQSPEAGTLVEPGTIVTVEFRHTDSSD